MDKMKYENFDLLIERAAQGYTVRVTHSPGGQARADFELPFSDLELENFYLRIGQSRRVVRRNIASGVDTAKEFGGKLFETVFAGELQSCLFRSLDPVQQQDAGLRIRLRMTDAPELADLPWEYLYNPALNRFLSLSTQSPIVRYLELPERIYPLKIDPPINVLAMISNPSDHDALDVEREWIKLQESVTDLQQCGLVTLTRLEKATLTTLQHQLRRGVYHIFHFIGHGGFDPQSREGILVFENDRGGSHPVSGQDLGILLYDQRPRLRLAFLNACEAGRSSHTDPFAGVAQSLVQQGIPAVIAMQFEISDSAAVVLSHEFYAALADNYPVDAALAEARKAVQGQGGAVEWGTPVLYMRAPDGRIFDVAQISQEQQTRIQITTLEQAARAAMRYEDWETAIEKYQAVLELDTAHSEAAARLKQAQQRQEQATQRPPEQDDRPAVRPDEADVDPDLKGNMRSEDKAITLPPTDPGQEASEKENGLFLSLFERITHLLSHETSLWIRIGILVAIIFSSFVLVSGLIRIITAIATVIPIITPTPTPTLTPTPTPTLTPTPTPTLTPTLEVLSDDGYGTYQLTWLYNHPGDLYPPTSYTFQEARDASFTNLTINETRTSPQSFANKPVGTYYYRVRGNNAYGAGAWSNVQTVVVSARGFFDDFNNPNSGWPRQVYSIDGRGVLDANYDNGTYRMKILLNQWGLNNRRMGIIPAPYTHTDNTYDIETQHRFVKAADQGDFDPTAAKAGIIFYGVRTGGGTGYFETPYIVEWNFEGHCSISRYLNYSNVLGHDPYIPVAWLERDPILLNWQPCPGLQAGYDKLNTARVEMRGTHINVFFNNTYVGTYSTTFSGSPHVGLMTGSWERVPAQSHFNYFRVTDQ